MRHRRIGSTDLVASEVGLTVGPLVAGPGARSDDDVADLLKAALDLGIGYFAATDSGRRRPGEELARPAVRGHRDELTVDTLRLRHHPAALGAGPGPAPARLVGRVRRPGA